MANVPISAFTVPANTVGIGATGYSLTGSASASFMDLAGTWNTSGTPTAIKLNITDTASASGSLLMDLQVGGSSKLKVGKDGSIFPAGSSSFALTSDGSQVYFYDNATSRAIFSVKSYLQVGISSGTTIGWANSTSAVGSIDTFLGRAGAASLRLGDADAAAPVAQTLGVQSVVAGTTNTAGTNFTIKGSAGTGTGAGGSIIFQVAPAGSSGSAQNALATALTINSDRSVTFNAANTSFGAGTTSNYLRVTQSLPFMEMTLGEIHFSANTLIGWGSLNNSVNGTVDTILRRDAANTLALRNGTAAQTFNIYNTYTDASNYERAFIKWSGNVLYIGSDKLGTGSARTLSFQTDGTDRWYVASTGHFWAAVDNTYDIGASGANRPRNVFVANNTTSVGFFTGTITGVFGTTGSGPSIRFSGSNIVLHNDDSLQNNFNLLNFGGSTAAYPALKRNGAALETKLANDSAYAPHAMQYLDVTDGITAPASATGRARIYVDTADGDLKVIFADGTVKTIVTDT